MTHGFSHGWLTNVGLDGLLQMLNPLTGAQIRLLGNYIDYLDNNFEAHYTQVIGGHDIGLFDLEERVAHNFFLNAHIISPTPIWLF